MKTKFIMTFAAAGLMLTGCSEEFLVTEPTEFASAEQIGEATALNPDIGAANVAGIYSIMYTPYTGGTTRHDDLGHKGNDIFGDMLSSDMVLGAQRYGWYTYISQMQATIDFTAISNYQVWRFYYRIIFSADQVIESYGGYDAIPETEENKHLLGQALAMRAFGYFYLAQYFSAEYNPSQEILPIYRGLDEPNQPKSTAQEVYGEITGNLNRAITLLEGFNRSNKAAVNKYVAKGLLAYAYASMGENALAKELANDVILNGGFNIMTAKEVVRMSHDGPDTTPYGGGFNDVSVSGWMWGVDLTPEINLGLVSWWGQMDIYSYSYSWVGDVKSIDIGLYDKIPANDVRKNQFQENYVAGQRGPVNKFFAPERVIGGATRIATSDYVYMRVAEMYLLHAETSAKSGDEVSARTSLKALLELRLDDVSYIDALSGQALEDEIYLQTRIELWGEGKSYLAMKRNKATITRGSNHLIFAGDSFRYDDDKLTFEIPLSEIQNNPHIN